LLDFAELHSLQTLRSGSASIGQNRADSGPGVRQKVRQKIFTSTGPLRPPSLGPPLIGNLRAQQNMSRIRFNWASRPVKL
jgi:hypothetical protein